LILRTLGMVYGAAAAWRRRLYARDPERRRRLASPVVSVGNLRVGGSGKTPLVEHVARLLAQAGHRPAVLTRGYGRRDVTAGVTVVSDGTRILAGLDEAGDEPLMLARALAGVPVLVSEDRYLAGRLAERVFGATVHVLDDGFQHFQLERDVDLLVVDESDLADRPMPDGRLREPLAAAAAADAVLVNAGYDAAADRIGRGLHVSRAFRATRTAGAPRTVPARDTVVVPTGARVFAVAGIARPERFYADLTSVGWQVVDTMTFRDHYRYRARDVARIASAARSAAAAIVLTTDKDAVRFEACALGDLPLAAVPLVAGVEPADAFRAWLLARVTARPSESQIPNPKSLP